MRRDVDFPRLRSLPGRRVVSAQAGERILRRGDQPSDLFVVVTGQVQLMRGGDALVTLGPAELFGEVALVGGTEQPYDAVAGSAATLIAIPASVLEAELNRAGTLARGLAQTLADRAVQMSVGAPGGEPTAPVSGAGRGEARPPVAPPAPASSSSPTDAGGSLLDLPPPPWEQAKQAEQEKATIDKSIPRPEAFWPRTTKCPICENVFAALQVRDTFVEVASRDSDLYEHHRGLNPMYYGIPVCPKCFYAAYPDDFNRLTGPEREAVGKALDPLRGRLTSVDFSGYRDAALARTAFELAILCYGARRPQYRKVAGLYHRLAWLARAAGDVERERAHLATARAGYLSALDKSQVDDARTELLLTYLIGDLSRRIGDLAEATRWAGMALQHPHLQRHKMIEELAQQLRADIRAARSATG